MQSKLFEEVLGTLDCLINTHLKYTELLEDVLVETLSNDLPSYFAQAVEHANDLEHAITLADETVNSLSEQLMCWPRYIARH